MINLKHLRHIVTWGYSVAQCNKYATSENYAE